MKKLIEKITKPIKKAFNPRERSSEKPVRKSGNTTRLVDLYIQRFFKEGKCVVVDHYDSRSAHNLAFRKVLMRLKHEHKVDISKLDLDKSNFVIKNPKHK